MKYLILIYSNPQSRAVWNNFTEAERAEAWQSHFRLVEELSESGEMVASEGLAGPSQGRRVRVNEDQTVTSDGPFAEVKEYLAGFFLIECETLERATECAARVPEAAHGLVEVRPVLARTALEL